MNIAFRVESLTRAVNKEVLASAAFLAGWEEAQAQFEPCGLHDVKGHPVQLEIYALKM